MKLRNLVIALAVFGLASTVSLSFSGSVVSAQTADITSLGAASHPSVRSASDSASQPFSLMQVMSSPEKLAQPPAPKEQIDPQSMQLEIAQGSLDAVIDCAVIALILLGLAFYTLSWQIKAKRAQACRNQQAETGGNSQQIN